MSNLVVEVILGVDTIGYPGTSLVVVTSLG